MEYYKPHPKLAELADKEGVSPQAIWLRTEKGRAWARAYRKTDKAKAYKKAYRERVKSLEAKH